MHYVFWSKTVGLHCIQQHKSQLSSINDTKNMHGTGHQQKKKKILTNIKGNKANESWDNLPLETLSRVRQFLPWLHRFSCKAIDLRHLVGQWSQYLMDHQLVLCQWHRYLMDQYLALVQWLPC
jgi:hypothetical protein